MKISKSKIPHELILRYLNIIKLIHISKNYHLDKERRSTHDLIKRLVEKDDYNFDFELARLCEAFLS